MSALPAGIPDADWLETPASVRALIIAQQQEIPALRQENDELRVQLTALASKLASLQERIGLSGVTIQRKMIRSSGFSYHDNDKVVVFIPARGVGRRRYLLKWLVIR